MRAWITGTPSSARPNIVSRYSSTGGWYSWGEWACPPCAWSAIVAAVGRGRHVERGVAVEEAERDQGEAGVLDGHDGPVLWPRDVGDAERVPQHDVGVDDRPVPSRPFG